jgi:hypothetical protein
MGAERMQVFNVSLPLATQQARPAARAIVCWAVMLVLTVGANTAKGGTFIRTTIWDPWMTI